MKYSLIDRRRIAQPAHDKAIGALETARSLRTERRRVRTTSTAASSTGRSEASANTADAGVRIVDSNASTKLEQVPLSAAAFVSRMVEISASIQRISRFAPERPRS
jgi:hypothetical protein